MSRIFWVLIAAGAVILTGCDKQPELTVEPIGFMREPTEAQPKLQTMKLYIGRDQVTAELAVTARQQQVGMMYRTNLAEMEGMLFPMPETRQQSFWMKNCPLPLSVAYIDPEGVIQEIHELQPHNTNSVPSASDNIRFVLEMPKGWFDRHQVKPGVSIATEHGSLMQTFFNKP